MSSNAPFAKRDQPILIAKVGKLKSNNDESEDSGDGHDESPAKNTLLYGNRVFIIRDELDPVKLETEITLTLPEFTFTVVQENGQEALYLAYDPDRQMWRRHSELQKFDRAVRQFFIFNEENVYESESNHFDAAEMERVVIDEAANGENADDEHDEEAVFNGKTNGTDMVSELYERLRQAHFENDQLITTDAPVQHPAMSATLKSYQAAAVRWMLHRELCQREESMFQRVFRRWPPSEDDGNETFFYNPLSNELSFAEMPTMELPSGGILCDEMGLGKTVEALALILLNKRPEDEMVNAREANEAVEQMEMDAYSSDSDGDSDDYYYSDDSAESPRQKKRKRNRLVSVRCICQSTQNAEPSTVIRCTKCYLRQHRLCVLRHVVGEVEEAKYICPQCWNFEEPVKTSATIIVSPRSIKMQWFDEVKKHINDDNFKVFLYDGTRGGNWINPIDLATYDLVLIDYETMSSEFKFVEASKVQRRHRYAPLFIKPISPLLKLDWWRVCLDEAQMVHSGVTCAAKLVAHLPATHHWAITGTPIDKSFNDLYGLFCFLDFEPYNCASKFRSMKESFTSGESDELVEVLWRVMWRTCKSRAILNEIAIPEQTEVVHMITPSDLEAYFYNEQYVSCYQAFQEKAKRLAEQQEKQLLSSLNPHVLKLLMEPLRKLRHDCSMPSILQKTDQRVNKSLLKPADLLQHMFSNTEIKVKSELRTVVSSLNGLAALYISQNKPGEAIKMYKKVLKWAAHYTGNISVDSLLQVHALYNLLSIGSSLPQDERDKYAEQLHKMEQKYIEPSAELVARIKIEQTNCSDRVDECERNFIFDEYRWWAQLLATREDGRTEQLMVRIHTELMEKTVFTNNTGLRMALTQWLDNLNADRVGVYESFKKLTYLTENLKALPLLDADVRAKVQKLIDSALDCHLDLQGGRRRRKETQPKMCELCLAKEQLEKYERFIQPEKKNDTDKDRDKKKKQGKTKEKWKLSQMEHTLRILRTQARQFDLSEDLQSDAKNHLKLMEALHNEFTELSQLWVEVNHAVSLYDEIEMCKSRLMVYDPIEIGTEKLPANTANLYVSKYDVDETMLTLHDQMKHAELEFVRKLGRLRYLDHLKKSSELENCPICCHPPVEKYVVLECGHHMCMICAVQWMETMATSGTLMCTICRHKQSKKSLYYVTLRSDVKVTDSSSKIEEIVQTVMKLKADDGMVKIVIFSHWPDILSTLEDALHQNDIECRSKLSTFAMTLRQFKDPNLNVTCLLLPLQRGSKGLNLTEATHVFLVEPILNPGEQLQAIGRIHRMGQTRPTVVHRFVVKNTIEETIYEQSKCDIWAFKNWTIDNLRKLFRGRDNNGTEHAINEQNP